MIQTGDYSIAEIKSYFTRKSYNSENVDDIEVGEIIEMRVNDNPPVDILVEIIDIEDGGVLIAEIIEVNGITDDHHEGDIIFIPIEILEWK
jgi:hypothetical protein